MSPIAERHSGSNGAAQAERQIATWRPYVWQDGGHVLILEVEPVGWVVAELRFDPCRCEYVEVHRAIYHWAREAYGAFLARALLTDETLMVTLANDLSSWVAMRFHPLASLKAT